MSAKPKSPLPWTREPLSGSTSSWIDDASGNDICRVSGEHVAMHDRDAEFIVKACNSYHELQEQLWQARGMALGLASLQRGLPDGWRDVMEGWREEIEEA